MISTKNQSIMKKKLLFCLLLINLYLLANAATPPTISYNTPFCQSSTVETVTFTGTTGGVFAASPFSLSINAITGTIDPSASVPGTYAVTYATPPGPDPAFVTTTLVTILAQPNAGINGSVTVCESSTTMIDLFSLIYGEQPGGTWTRVVGVGGTFNASAGTFTPAFGTTTSGFEYRILATAPCTDDYSVAFVEVFSQPDGGLDGSVNVSNTTNTSINLYSIISGFQPGGIWTRTSGTGGTFNAALGTFNPYPDATSSTFSYTVTGVAPCVSDSSVAAVTTSSTVVPQFSVIAALCSGAVAPNLPLVSNNGITGSWTPATIDNTLSETYTFTPDAGQSAVSVTFTIQIIPAPTATVVVPDTVIIGSPYVVMFLGTPNANLTYQFNGGTIQTIVLNNTGQATIFFENAVTSTICLISASNVCTTLLNDCVTVNVVPVPAPIGNPIQTFNQGQTLADLVVSGSNIQWYSSALNRNSLSTPLPLSTVLVNGETYFASQTINGFESPERFGVLVQLALADDNFNFRDLKFSPNPIQDVLYIQSKDLVEDVTVFNIMGQKVLQQNFDSLDLRLPLSQLKTGNYFIKLKSHNKSQVIKVIKE